MLTTFLRVVLILSCLSFPASAAEDLLVFKLDMKDGVMAPLVIEAPAGKPFKIEITNSGRTPAEFESLELRKEKVLAPGATSSVVFRKLSPGNYVFFDEFHMDAPKGQLVVK
ncbi:MAG: cupredoxin domain-containing protein [Rhodospirillales bacterium]|nr:MAG: cupredoxin domain-containing protein [Rhodospirillales bacterium]